MKTYFKFSIVIFLLIQVSCSTEKPKSEKATTAEKSTQSSKFSSETEVKEYLKDAGVLLTINGNEIFKEDNLKDISYKDLTGSLDVLLQSKESNETAIFYLKVAGASMDHDENRNQFINSYISADEEFYKTMDKMVKFLQRQDRPMIKSALLNITSEINEDQCLEFLQFTGYISGTAVSSFTYNEKVLRTFPMFFKVALLDKLRKSEGRGSMVYDQMAASLGVS